MCVREESFRLSVPMSTRRSLCGAVATLVFCGLAVPSETAEICGALNTDVVSCAPGVRDCCYGHEFSDKTDTCSEYSTSLTSMPKGKLWILVVGGVIAMAMAYTIGSNDSANAWGTSVGSGAISLSRACFLGGIGEFLGATSLGAGVSGTIQNGVARLTTADCWACGNCDSKMAMYQFGMFTAMVGAAVFLALVTFAAMPVSTTHAIVGGVVGMTVTATSRGCLNWSFDGGLGGIVISWVASPLLAGLLGCGMYLATYLLILKRDDPVKAALRAIPLLYGLTSAFMIYLILLKSPITASAISAKWRWISSGLSLVIVPIAVKLFVMSSVRADLESREFAGVIEETDAEEEEEEATECHEVDETLPSHRPFVGRASGRLITFTAAESTCSIGCDGSGGDDSASSGHSSSSNVSQDGDATEKTIRLLGKGQMTSRQKLATLAFKNLLVFNAFVESFAHGANDTANATGPYGALVGTYMDGIYACKSVTTPTWIMAVAGLCVAFGVNISGWRVIQTMGKDLTAIDFHKGYCVEFASGASVVIASFFEMPVSTTHCQVGAVVFVGALSGGCRSVSWTMLGRIAITWVCTLPFAGGLASGLMWFRFFS